MLRGGLALQGIESLRQVADGLVDFHGLSSALRSIDTAPPGIPASFALDGVDTLVAALVGARLHRPSISRCETWLDGLHLCSRKRKEVVVGRLELTSGIDDLLRPTTVTCLLHRSSEFAFSGEAHHHHLVGQGQEGVDGRFVSQGPDDIFQGLVSLCQSLVVVARNAVEDSVQFGIEVRLRHIVLPHDICVAESLCDAIGDSPCTVGEERPQFHLINLSGGIEPSESQQSLLVVARIKHEGLLTPLVTRIDARHIDRLCGAIGRKTQLEVIASVARSHTELVSRMWGERDDFLD